MLLAAIADDFTGGLELASLMVREGLSARMVTRHADAAAIGDVDAVVFALKSRVAPASEAVAGFAKACDLIDAKGGARQVFFKYCATFDSTPRGNIGPCADYLAERYGAGFVGFCPAFPDVKRTVYQGHLFYADQLISRSPKRLDPLTPMKNPNLVEVLQAQTRHPVGLIRHEDVIGGADTLRARAAALEAEGKRYAICDAVDNDDLRRLAQVCIDWPVMTGGGTITEHYPALWRARSQLRTRTSETALPRVEGPAVVLAGSCAEQTRAQLDHFEQTHPVLRLDLLDMADNAGAIEKASAWMHEKLRHGPLAVAVQSSPEAVAEAQQRFGRKGAGRRGEKLLGRVAIELHRAGVRRFVVAGGETSGAVLEALKVKALDTGPYIAGAGAAQAVTRGADPVSFHLKSGKLGSVDMFSRVIAG
ncbi:3-oxo-tetronate kinase [Taklimakanibacter lacteus]|uniref:3-oxo-tetronate kinase n=1 Tax=Taklimakanibacter lacteus TaxID=2268456 RepID=UPI000E66FD5C